MSPVSPAALAAMFAQETGAAAWTLLRVAADVEYRWVNNTEPVTSDGEVYTPLAFTVAPPVDSGDELPRARLQLDNADRAQTLILRAYNGPPPLVRMSVVLSTDPSDVIYGPFRFEARGARNRGLESVIVDLYGHDVRNEGFPGPIYDPAHFPAGFYA